jgi:hypothetical protein
MSRAHQRWYAEQGQVDGSGLPNFSDRESPTGLIDGVNAIFTLSHTPSPATSLLLTKNGQTMYAGTAFTLSANQITFLGGYIPVTGDVLFCWYRY